MNRTNLENYERQAMTGDRIAILKVVSSLRKYRELFKQLLNSPQIDLPESSMEAWEAQVADIEGCDE